MTTVTVVVRFLSVAAVFVGASIAAAAEVTGRVTEVTLYRGQAMITRSVPVEGPAGAVEVVVGELPEQVVPNSLFAEGSEALEVRAVRFRTRAVGEEPREEVRKLDEALEQLQERLGLIVKAQAVLAKRTAYLDQLEGFVAPTAKAELSKGVLDAEALQKITLFSFEQREEIAKAQIEQEKQAKELNKEISLLQRKRSQLTSGRSRTVREAVLFLQKHAAGKDSLRLNYLAAGCGWSPAYTFRGASDQKQVGVECNALIQQMTGEDWNNVTLTLSTASPALASSGPGLGPFPVTLTKGPQSELSRQELASQVRSIRSRQSKAIVMNRSAMNLVENIGSSWTANSAANDFQCLELINGKDVLNMLLTGDLQSDAGPSLSYQLRGGVSLASRSDQQMVRILNGEFDSLLYYVATPVLTSHVYREAKLKNTGEKDLLAGPITVYLDGRFVGRGEIPTVARGQSFVVGFGADPQLRAGRELASRTEGVQGGNRELSFKYRLVIENYKEKAVPVRLFDRLPHSERTADIRITLGDMKDPLSSEQLYLRTERPKGILRWDIEAPASATGEKARIIEYGYTLDFDRNFAISTIGGEDDPAAAAAEQEFEIQQRARLAH